MSIKSTTIRGDLEGVYRKDWGSHLDPRGKMARLLLGVPVSIRQSYLVV